jgi:putative endonuclease
LSKKALGNLGEAVACAYLQQKGYILLAHQFRAGALELDLVMQDGETLVFIEVKTRKNSTFGLPEESVSYSKQQHLLAAAEAYLSLHVLEVQACRFDVVSVIPNGKSYRINHLENAFWAE